MAKPIVAFGDSNMLGHGLPGYTGTPTAQAFISIVANTLGVEKTVFAVSGNMIADQGANKLYSNPPSAQNYYVAMLGTNDVSHYGSSAVKRAAAMAFMRNIATWNLCVSKTFARSGEVVYTGAWSNTPANSIGRNTSAAGSSAQATVSGNAAYVSFIIQTNVLTEFDILVDGVLAKSVSYNGSLIGNTAAGQGYAPACEYVDGLSEGPHDIKIVHKAGITYLDYIAGSAQSAKSHFFLAEIPMWNGGSADNVAAINAYNAGYADIVDALESHGHNIYIVKHSGFLIPSIHYNPSDGIHPNVAGHAALAASYLAVMQPIDDRQNFEPGYSPFALYRTTFLDKPVIQTTYH